MFWSENPPAHSAVAQTVLTPCCFCSTQSGQSQYHLPQVLLVIVSLQLQLTNVTPPLKAGSAAIAFDAAHTTMLRQHITGQRGCLMAPVNKSLQMVAQGQQQMPVAGTPCCHCYSLFCSHTCSRPAASPTQMVCTQCVQSATQSSPKTAQHQSAMWNISGLDIPDSKRGCMICADPTGSRSTH